MRKFLTVLASFIIMLCIGSVYAWSIIASELIEEYGFSASQSQIIFGTLIAIFPVTMILVGQLGEKNKAQIFRLHIGLIIFFRIFFSKLFSRTFHFNFDRYWSSSWYSYRFRLLGCSYFASSMVSRKKRAHNGHSGRMFWFRCSIYVGNFR